MVGPQLNADRSLIGCVADGEQEGIPFRPCHMAEAELAGTTSAGQGSGSGPAAVSGDERCTSVKAATGTDRGRR